MVPFQCHKSWTVVVEILSLKIRISVNWMSKTLHVLLACLKQASMAACRNKSPASLGASDKEELIANFLKNSSLIPPIVHA